MPIASRWPGLSPLPVTRPVVLACWPGVLAREMWLVIWTTAVRLTAASPARTKARQRPARTKATHTASSPSTTAVARATFACIQSCVSTAGSAKLKAAPNPAVGTDVPA